MLPRRRRAGRRRARLRHRLLLGLARPARCAAGRRRRHPAQLETARRAAAGDRDRVPAARGERGESVPLPDASFDLALSEYGASIWGDPYRWIPEAARLLGRAASSSSCATRRSSILCAAARRPARRAAAAAAARAQPDRLGGRRDVEFHLPLGELIALLRADRLRGLEHLVELYAPDGRRERTSTTTSITAEWARSAGRAEEIWRARKR